MFVTLMVIAMLATSMVNAAPAEEVLEKRLSTYHLCVVGCENVYGDRPAFQACTDKCDAAHDNHTQ